MALIEEGQLLPSAVPRAVERRAREAIQFAADQVLQRVAGERVQRQQHDVDQQDQRAHADAEVPMRYVAVIPKKEGANGVIPEEAKEDHGGVKKIAMDILQDEGETGLAAIIAMRRLSHGAGRRVEKECAIVGLSVVIAGRTETERKNQNQQCRREGPPTVRCVDERGIER